jgi:hypothetical protein
MNKTGNQWQETLDKGWSIQVYSSDRRLICSLYPSHGWAFLAGIVVGFIVSLTALNSRITTHSAPTAPPMNAPLNLD